MPRSARVAILLAVFICFSQIDASYAATDDTKTFVPIGITTKGYKVGLEQFNGRFWNKLDLNKKSIFILGMLDGINSFYISSDPVGENYIEKFDKIKDSFHPKGFTNVEIAKIIDGFYEDNSNIKIPIFEMMKCVVLKTKGTLKDDLDKMLSGLRKKYN